MGEGGRPKKDTKIRFFGMEEDSTFKIYYASTPSPLIQRVQCAQKSEGWTLDEFGFCWLITSGAYNWIWKVESRHSDSGIHQIKNLYQEIILS